MVHTNSTNGGSVKYSYASYSGLGIFRVLGFEWCSTYDKRRTHIYDAQLEDRHPFMMRILTCNLPNFKDPNDDSLRLCLVSRICTILESCSYRFTGWAASPNKQLVGHCTLCCLGLPSGIFLAHFDLGRSGSTLFTQRCWKMTTTTTTTTCLRP